MYVPTTQGAMRSLLHTVPVTDIAAGETSPRRRGRMHRDRHGGTTWTPEDGYTLGSQNPADNATWGFGRAYLSSAVPPGGEATFGFNVMAPSTAGAYNFQWRMLRENVEWFGAQTPNNVVTVVP